MIVASALKVTDGTVHTGRRHSDIFHRYKTRRPKNCFLNCTQGFVTDAGEFLDREAAAQHAIACGQITETKWGPQLYSEDLW